MFKFGDIIYTTISLLAHWLATLSPGVQVPGPMLSAVLYSNLNSLSCYIIATVLMLHLGNSVIEDTTIGRFLFRNVDNDQGHRYHIKSPDSGRKLESHSQTGVRERSSHSKLRV